MLSACHSSATLYIPPTSLEPCMLELKSGMLILGKKSVDPNFFQWL